MHSIGRPRGNGPVGMTDLLERIARLSDVEAFKEFYGRYGQRIRRFMMRRGADAALADDLTQETFLSVWSKARYYDPSRGDEAGWVYAIARNLHIDRMRRQRSFQEMTAALDPPREATDGDDVVDSLAAAQASVRINTAIRELPKDQAEVIRLAFMDGLGHLEIAGRLKLPLGTVKSRLRLAYAKLRSSLEDLA